MYVIATDDRRRSTRRLWVALAVSAALLVSLAPTSSRRQSVGRAHAARGRAVHVIVTAAPGAQRRVAAAVGAAGGTVLHALPIVNGFDAVVPAAAVPRIALTPGVRSVTPDA